MNKASLAPKRRLLWYHIGVATLFSNHTIDRRGDDGRLGFSACNICNNFYTPEVVQDGGYHRGGGDDCGDGG